MRDERSLDDRGPAARVENQSARPARQFAAPRRCIALGSQRYDVTGAGAHSAGSAVVGPVLHQPSALFQDVAALIGPFLNGDTTTFGDIFLNSSLNLIGNGLAAGLLAPLAIRVAQSINQTASAPAVEPSAAGVVAGGSPDTKSPTEGGA